MEDYKYWKIGENSFLLDMQDLEGMERYENATELLKQEDEERPKKGKLSVQIRSYCEMHRRFYDRVFGEGTAEKLFEHIPMNADLYDEVILDFGEFIQNQFNQAGIKKQNTLEKLKKFTPAKRKQNRK